MTARPSVVPNIDSNATARVAPPAGVQTDGYSLNDILPSTEYNHTQGFAADWLRWLDERSRDGAVPAGDLFLQGSVGDTSGTGNGFRGTLAGGAVPAHRATNGI